MKSFCMAVFILIAVSAFAGAVELTTEYHQIKPKYYMQNGQHKGIGFDIITTLNTRLQSDNISIVLKYPAVPFVPWKRIQENLAKGHIDIFVGMGRDDDRMTKYRFIDVPLFRVRSTFAKRVEDPFEFTGRKSLKTKRIVVLKGTKTARTIKNANCSIVYEVGTLEQGFKMLLNKRADLIFHHETAITCALKATGMAQRIDLTRNSVSSYHTYAALNPNVPEPVIRTIGKALKQMKKDGILEQIIRHYR